MAGLRSKGLGSYLKGMKSEPIRKSRLGNLPGSLSRYLFIPFPSHEVPTFLPYVGRISGFSLLSCYPWIALYFHYDHLNLQPLKYFFLFFTSEPSSLLSVPFLGREQLPAAFPLLAISHYFCRFPLGSPVPKSNPQAEPQPSFSLCFHACFPILSLVSPG